MHDYKLKTSLKISLLAVKVNARSPFLRVLSNTKEILIILCHFSSSNSTTAKRFLKADFS